MLDWTVSRWLIKFIDRGISASNPITYKDGWVEQLIWHGAPLQVPYADWTFDYSYFLSFLISNANTEAWTGTKYVESPPATADSIENIRSNKTAPKWVFWKATKQLDESNFQQDLQPTESHHFLLLLKMRSEPTIDELIFANDYQHQHNTETDDDESSQLKFANLPAFRLVRRTAEQKLE